MIPIGLDIRWLRMVARRVNPRPFNRALKALKTVLKAAPFSAFNGESHVGTQLVHLPANHATARRYRTQ